MSFMGTSFIYRPPGAVANQLPTSYVTRMEFLEVRKLTIVRPMLFGNRSRRIAHIRNKESTRIEDQLAQL